MPASSRPRRRNTIWDLSALRIRADGTRIAQDLVDGTRTGNSRRMREGNSVVMTSRGWIANEAGGSLPWKVKRKRKKQNDGDEDTEEFDVGSVTEEGSQTGKKRKARGTGRTAQRRRKLDEDLWFIGNEEALRIPLNDDGTPFVFPTPPAARLLPDADFLKHLHYLASVYFTERNQMHDLPRQHRAALRKRKGMRKQIKEREEAIAEGLDPGPEIEYNEDWPTWMLAPKPGRRKKEEMLPPGSIPKDMYRAFNHSALMCIAMLIEEHVYSIVTPRATPEDWAEPEDDEDEDEPDEFNPTDLGAHVVFKRSRPVHASPKKKDQFYTKEDEVQEEEVASGSEYDPDDD